MASRSDLRFCVRVNGVLKRLFSVKELKNGDLTIILKSADHYRDEGTWSIDNNRRIVHQKYSVHRSLQSETGINALVHRLKMDDGVEYSTSHYTRALKQTNRHAALYSARIQDLRPEKYTVDENEQFSREIASFDSSKATFHYMLFVCNLESDEIRSTADIAVRYFSFTHFRIAALWSFASVPSHYSALKCHFLTVDTQLTPPDTHVVLESLGDGFDLLSAVNYFRVCRALQHKELYDVLAISNPEVDSTQRDFLFALPFTNSPLQI